MKRTKLIIALALIISSNGIAQTVSNIAEALTAGQEEKALELVGMMKTGDDNIISLLKNIIRERGFEDQFPLIKAEVLFKVGSFYQQLNQFDSSFHYFNLALVLNDEIYNRAGSAKCLYPISRSLAIEGKYEQARDKANRGLYLARYLGNKELEIQLGNILSWSFFSMNHNFDRILEHEGNQLELARSLEISNSTASIFNNYGYDHSVSGLVHIDSLIEIMNVANNQYATSEGHSGRWNTLMNLTWLYRLKEDHERSEKAASMSFERALEIQDRHAVIESAFQYGETLMAGGKLALADPFYREGLKERGDEKDRDAYVFDVYYANYLWATNQKKEALQRLEEAIQFLSNGEVFYEMHGRALLAGFYSESGYTQKAMEHIKIFEHPRSKYIAFESRCMMACVKAKYLSSRAKKGKARALLRAYLEQAQSIGASYLVRLINETWLDLQL